MFRTYAAVAALLLTVAANVFVPALSTSAVSVRPMGCCRNFVPS